MITADRPGRFDSGPCRSMPPIPVIVDKDEKRPWDFDASKFAVEVRHLPTGDYTLRDFADRLTIERKSLGDLVNSVIHDWLRFRKQLYRMAAFDVAVIVVEADLGDVMAHRYESDADPQSVIGRCHSMLFDHGIPCLFWGPRPGCVRMAERFLALAAKKLGADR